MGYPTPATPAGHWLVLRMGYSPTGVPNHPVSPEGTGLEVDKLSNDVPLAAMWTQAPSINNDQPGYNANVHSSGGSPL